MEREEERERERRNMLIRRNYKIIYGNDCFHFLLLSTINVWFRVMVGEQPGSRGKVVGHVNVSHTRVEDGGRYQCVAANRAGEASHSASLNIYGECVCVWVLLLLFFYNIQMDIIIERDR